VYSLEKEGGKYAKEQYLLKKIKKGRDYETKLTLGGGKPQKKSRNRGNIVI